jgi:hypothetical protein
MCFVLLVENGSKQLLKQPQIFHIPDNLTAPKVFCYLVSLFEAVNIPELDGFDKLFSSFVDVLKDL